MDESKRRREICELLELNAKELSKLSREIYSPIESYSLLASLVDVQTSLAHSYELLASWHASALDGTHYVGEDPGPELGTTAVAAAAGALQLAAAEARTVVTLLRQAHQANGVVRWNDVVNGQ